MELPFDDTTYFKEILLSLHDKWTGVTDIKTNHNLAKTYLELNHVKGKLERYSLTAQLCIDYQKVMATIKTLIKPDKLGPWTLHLEALN